MSFGFPVHISKVKGICEESDIFQYRRKESSEETSFQL